MKKKVSVIVPCYNVEKWIDRCVRSLVQQTIGIDNLELIFVDDASTDSTLTHLKRWEKRFPDSLIVISCKKNGRQGTAKNIGLLYATAPYIGYVDSDDWVEVEMFEILYDAAREYDVDVVSCMYARDKGDGIFFDIREFHGIIGEKVEIDSAEDRHKFLGEGFPYGGVVTQLYKKSFLNDKKICFPEGLAYEDNFFGTIVMYELSSYYNTTKILYHYFYNDNSTVTARNSKHQLDRIEIEEALLVEMKKRGFFDEFYEEICGRFLKVYYLNKHQIIFKNFYSLLTDVMEHIRDYTIKNFSDWKDCSVYKEFSSLEKGFLQTLETDMTIERWENLKENYLYLISQNNK